MSIDPYSFSIHCPWCKTKHEVFAEDAGKSLEVICSHCGVSITSTVRKDGTGVHDVHATRSHKTSIKGHSGDCTIFATLNNGNPEDGICICGYGLEKMRQGDLSEMYSDEKQIENVLKVLE